MKQTVIMDGKGKARRLMVRGRKGIKVKDYGFITTWSKEKGHHYKKEYTEVPLDGPYIGTKRMPKGSAKRHPKTGEPQVQYVLVQHSRKYYVENTHAAPPSDVEFYWQEGTMRNGRFRPIKTDPPQADQPKP